MIRLDMDRRMPEGCTDCPFVYDNIWCSALQESPRIPDESYYADERAPFCPLQEITEREWIDRPDKHFPRVECPECGSDAGAAWMNYCPVCGTKMKGRWA